MTQIAAGIRAALAACVFCLPLKAQAGPAPDASPRAWLEAMAQALRHLNYEGELIYQQGQTLELLHQKHWIEAGEERERLTSLNGPVREVVRDHRGARCLLSNNQSVAVRRLGAVTGFPSLTALSEEGLNDLYEISFGEQARLAGHQAQGIEIRPRDGLRYGFRIYLDAESRLPIKQMMLDTRGEPLVTMMYSRLQAMPTKEVAPASTEPPVRQDKAQPTSVQPTPAQPTKRQTNGRWFLSELPPGFRVSLHNQQAMGEPAGTETDMSRHPGQLEHLVLSDGLATVSLYIESGAESDTDGGLEGLSRMGVTGAYGRRLGNYQITAVGEVPEAALRWIAEAVRVPE